jgi:hypothetical protein
MDGPLSILYIFFLNNGFIVSDEIPVDGFSNPILLSISWKLCAPKIEKLISLWKTAN